MTTTHPTTSLATLAAAGARPSATLARDAGGGRWTVAVASCLVQLALGTIYSSSVLVRPMMDAYSVSKTAATLAFTISIVALGITAGFGGSFQRRFGPRATATASGLLYGGGVCLAGIAPNLATFYLGFGIIGGIGLGLGYIVPVAMLLRWFPDKRGLISGLAVAGFGGGAMVVSPVATGLLTAVGLHHTLVLLGLGYLVVIVAGAQFFRAAPEGFVPAGWTPPSAAGDRGGRHATLAEALRAPSWYLLWLILALNVTSGTALVSVAAPLAQSFCGLDAATAALVVGAISITNGFGRPFWGWASDKIGRPATFATLFVIQVFAFRALGHVSDFSMLLVLAAVIGMCLGAGFAAMPAFAADFFGSKHTGAIYGAMLTAWSAGAVAGPLVMTGLDYRVAAADISWLMLASVPLPIVAAARGALSADALLDLPRTLRGLVERRADWIGLVLLSLGVACLQPKRAVSPRPLGND